MVAALKPILVENFTEGLQTAKPAHSIPDGASPFMINVDIGRGYDGVLAKRQGTATRISELAGGRITGLWEFVRLNNGWATGSTGSFGTAGPVLDNITTYLYASADRDVYELIAPSTWTSRYHNDAIQGTDITFATFNNQIYMVNQGTTTNVGSGGAPFTIALGTPPANGKFIASWMGRLWIANTSAGRSRVHWSAANNGQDWVTVGDAGFVDVNPDDGQEITALVPSGDYLYIFKRHSVHVISGYKPDNFVLHKIPDVDGCIYHRTAVDHGGAVFYLSDNGVRVVSGGGAAIGEVTPLIRYDIQNLTQAQKMGACAGINKFKQYWLCFDSNGDDINDAAYVLNFLPQIQCWSYYTNIKASVFLSLNNTEFISGGDDKIVIRTQDTGESDEGAVIPFEWRSKQHEWTNPFDFKKLQDLGIHTKVLAGKTLTINTLVDGIDTGDTITLSLSQTLGATQDNLTFLFKMKGIQQGRSIQFIFKNSEANTPIEIYSYTALAEVIERQYST